MKRAAQLLIIGVVLFLSPRETSASTLYFPHTNHQGSVVAVTDESGEVVSQDRYYPYGEEKASQGDQNASERKYTSQIKDTEADLYYYNARYYDPTLSTFVSADSTNDQLNRYAYVGGNPTNYMDPTGNRRTICNPTKTDNGTCIITGQVKEPLTGYETSEVYSEFHFLSPYTITWGSVGRAAAVAVVGATAIGIAEVALPYCAMYPSLCIHQATQTAGRVSGPLDKIGKGTAITRCLTSGGADCADLQEELLMDMNANALDVGSWAGENIRTPRTQTTTLDIVPNRGIDVNANAYDLPFADESYGVITSDYLPAQAYMEGEQTPRLVEEIDRVLSPEGIVSIRAADTLRYGNDFMYPHRALWQNFVDLGYEVKPYIHLGGGLAGPEGSTFYLNQYQATFIKPQ